MFTNLDIMVAVVHLKDEQHNSQFCLFCPLLEVDKDENMYNANGIIF